MTENNDYSYLLDVLKLAESGEEKDESEKVNLQYKGDFFSENNSSKFNFNLANVIVKDSSYNLTLIPIDPETYNPDEHNSLEENVLNPLEDINITFSHTLEPNFKMPNKGHWILMQNWDYGSIPSHWVESINDYVDQLWVSSEYNKECFVSASIKPEKIKVINSAVDSLFFNPHVNPIQLNTEKSKKILFKGDLNWESGFDLLLKAFTDEFIKEEDICLVVLTNTENNSQMNEKIHEFKKRSDCPEIMVIDYPTDQKNLIAFYKSCDFLISPYRAESYCFNIIESMACGVPAIVPDYGSAKDYCNNENSVLFKTSIMHQNDKEIKDNKTDNYPFWCQADLMDLRVKLRYILDMDNDTYNSLSKKASKTILENHTWVKLNDKIKEYFQELKENSIKRERQKELQLKILEGVKLLNKGNFLDAEAKLNEAFEFDSSNSNLNFYLANILLSKGNIKKSFEYMINALKLTPDSDDYNNFVGILLFKLGNYKLAKEFFLRTLEINNDFKGAKDSLKAINDLDEKTFNNTKFEISDQDLEFLNSIIKTKKAIKLPSLSVCIIARNEQKSIEKAIKSVNNIADEIIVLDTGSNDNTIEISKKNGAIVYETEWKNDFSLARNEAKKYATKDWILMLDADEVLSAESGERIKPTLFSLSKDKIYLPRIINIINNDDSQELIEHYVPRIIPNIENIKFIRPIHEFPVNSDNSILESENLKGIDILHFGYSQKVVQEKNKLERNRVLLEKMYNEEPESPLNLYYLSENYLEANKLKEVKDLLSKAVKLGKKEENKVYENILYISQIKLIDILIQLGEVQEAKEKIQEFKEDISDRPDYWFLNGSAELNLGNYDKAIEYSKEALKLRSKDVYPSIDIGTVTWKPLNVIAEAYEKKDELENSIIFYSKAIKEAPLNISIYYKLSGLYAKTEQLEKMENILGNIISSLNPEELFNVLDKTISIYLEKDMHERLYKILEDIRITYFKSKLPLSKLEFFNNKLIELYNKILESKEDFIAANYSIGCCYTNLGKLNEAKEIFEKIVEEDEFEVDSLHNLASIALTQKDVKKAEELYNQVLEIDEFHTEAYLSLAKMELGRQNIEKAKEYLEELQTIDPDNKEISQIEFEIASMGGNKKLASDMYAAMLFNNF